MYEFLIKLSNSLKECRQRKAIFPVKVVSDLIGVPLYVIHNAETMFASWEEIKVYLEALGVKINLVVNPKPILIFDYENTKLELDLSIDSYNLLMEDLGLEPSEGNVIAVKPIHDSVLNYFVGLIFEGLEKKLIITLEHEIV